MLQEILLFLEARHRADVVCFEVVRYTSQILHPSLTSSQKYLFLKTTLKTQQYSSVMCNKKQDLL